MKKILSAIIITICALVACERPNSPDFKLEHRFQTPIVLEKTYAFLGGANALIDTTSDNFDSLFTVDGNGLVTLSKVQDISFQNMDDVIPAISATSTQVNTQVGEISLDDFSSQTNLGSAGFQDITGQPSGSVSPGDNLPAGSGSATVDLNTDYFVSATIAQDGQINVTITNDLGFDINDGAVLTLKADNTDIGSTPSFNINHTETVTQSIDIPAGSVLQVLTVEVQANWTTQNMQDNPNNLVIDGFQGNGLVASEVEAVVSSQDFTSSGQTSISDEEFELRDADHFAELESGQLHIHDIINNLDLDIDELTVSFPDIRSAPFSASDSLVVKFEGATKIPRNSQNQVEKNIDLSGYRVYAQNNVIDYNVDGFTENTQQGAGSQARVIRSTDNVSTTVDIENMSISTAHGVISPKNILLNEDDPSNGTDQVDVFYDNEAEVVSISGFDELSDKLSGVEFANPKFTLNYQSNIGTEAEVFSAIVATNSKNEQVFLTGDQGSEYVVNSGEAPNGLLANGSQISSNNLIKFSIDTTWSGQINSAVQFDRTNSNLDEFFNILPSEIRFISSTSVNPNTVEGYVQTPVMFNPSISVDLPLNIASTGSTYEDTLAADLSDLPGQDSDQKLVEARITFEYVNNLPLRFELNLTFLDDMDQEITSTPLAGEEPIAIAAAPVNQQTRFVEQAEEGVLQFGLNREQMENLYKTQNLLLQAGFNTSGEDNVRIRAEDSISFKIGLDVRIETTVKND